MLAFHPPPPFYQLTFDEERGEYISLFDPSLPQVPYPNLKVFVLKTASNSNINVFYLRNPNAKFTILFSHGNATDLGAMYVVYAMLAISLDVSVIAFDYTGYGPQHQENYIFPSEKQIYLDIQCVYDWCTSNSAEPDSPRIMSPATELILYGQSVGSGPSLYIASQSTCPVAGLILHSPIRSGLRVLTESRLLGCWDIFPNQDRISRVQCPVFVIHGLEDREVGVGHGQILHSRVPAEFQTPPWWVPKRGHNDVLSGNEREFISRIDNFLNYILSRQQVTDDLSQSEPNQSQLLPQASKPFTLLFNHPLFPISSSLRVLLIPPRGVAGAEDDLIHLNALHQVLLQRNCLVREAKNIQDALGLLLSSVDWTGGTPSLRVENKNVIESLNTRDLVSHQPTLLDVPSNKLKTLNVEFPQGEDDDTEDEEEDNEEETPQLEEKDWSGRIFDLVVVTQDSFHEFVSGWRKLEGEKSLISHSSPRIFITGIFKSDANIDLQVLTDVGLSSILNPPFEETIDELLNHLKRCVRSQD